MTNTTKKIDGKKFMWDKRYYSTKAEAKEKKELGPNPYKS